MVSLIHHGIIQSLTPFTHSLYSLPILLGSALGTEGQVALSTVLTVSVLGHKDTRTTRGRRALLTKAVNLASIIDTVIFHHCHANLHSLMLNLLRGGVSLLLLLLGTTTEA